MTGCCVKTDELLTYDCTYTPSSPPLSRLHYFQGVNMCGITTTPTYVKVGVVVMPWVHLRLPRHPLTHQPRCQVRHRPQLQHQSLLSSQRLFRPLNLSTSPLFGQRANLQTNLSRNRHQSLSHRQLMVPLAPHLVVARENLKSHRVLQLLNNSVAATVI